MLHEIWRLASHCCTPEQFHRCSVQNYNSFFFLFVFLRYFLCWCVGIISLCGASTPPPPPPRSGARWPVDMGMTFKYGGQLQIIHFPVNSRGSKERRRSYVAPTFPSKSSIHPKTWPSKGEHGRPKLNSCSSSRLKLSYWGKLWF